MSKRSDVIVIGAGAIGLATAFELARSEVCVTVLDANSESREASWAGAGILPPGSWYSRAAWAEQFADCSREMFAKWAPMLCELTGVDIEYRQCGGTYLVEPDSPASVSDCFTSWKQRGIAVEQIDAIQLTQIEPNLLPVTADTKLWHTPGECQVRNPRFLQALAAAIAKLGGSVQFDAPVDEIEIQNDRATGVRVAGQLISADQVCVAAGAWTSRLLARWIAPESVKPIRGQMLLLKEESPSLSGQIHYVTGNADSGNGYAVPRIDGHALVGSTVEDVGFDKATTDRAIARFRELAGKITSGLASAQQISSWSGLRPASASNAPIIGPIPEVERLFVASGHFRAGLQFAPPTARLVSSMMQDDTLPFDPSPFRVEK